MAYLPIQPEVVAAAKAMFPEHPVPVGTKVWFWTEKRAYKVVGSSERFLICIKPFNIKRTFLYSIVDFKRGHRGPVNLIFGIQQDLNKPEEVKELLYQLENEGDVVEVSHRHGCNVHIDRIELPK